MAVSALSMLCRASTFKGENTDIKPTPVGGSALEAVHHRRQAHRIAAVAKVADPELKVRGLGQPQLSRAGDRRLNCCLHTIAITQIARDPRDGSTTEENAPQAKATEKRCAASIDDSPTTPIANRCATQPELGQTREDTRGRLQQPARPAQTPHTDTSDKSLPGPPAATLQPTPIPGS